MKKIILHYYNPVLKIALRKWNEAYLIDPKRSDPLLLKPEIYKGNLVCRLRGSDKRIAYKQIKANLVLKKNNRDTGILFIPFLALTD